MDAEWRGSFVTTRKWGIIWISWWEVAPALAPRELETFALPFVVLLSRITVLGGCHLPNYYHHCSLWFRASFFTP